MEKIENIGACKKEKKILSTGERCEIQIHLINDLLVIKNIKDEKQRHIFALEWVAKYADNLDQVDGGLIERYKKSTDEKEKDVVLDEIQEALIILNKING
jgi:hypothetical protein